jgi:hypothetical protein
VKKRAAKRTGIGSAFDDFLKSEGTYEATQGVAIKRVLAWQTSEPLVICSRPDEPPAHGGSDIRRDLEAP